MVLGLDLGSSLVHAALVDPVGRLVRESVRKIHRAHPGPGLVEHDLRDLWKQCISVIREALSVSEYQARRRVGKFQDTIEAMGISTQRNTLAVWDRDSGEPLFPAISWSDSRTADLLKRLSSTDAQGSFRKITHRDLSTTNLGLKLRWLLEANPQLEGDLRSGKVCWGTLDTWILWRLSGGAVWLTDASSAATTGIYDIGRNEWSTELLELLGLDGVPFPQVMTTSGFFAVIKDDLLGIELPITCLIGDQYASMLAQGCVRPGRLKCTLGSGGFLLGLLEKLPSELVEGLITRICWRLGETTAYGLEGFVFHVGTLLSWLMNALGFAENYDELPAILSQIEPIEGLYLVPAFSGLASPYWDPSAQSLLIGLTFESRLEHLLMAGLEAIAFQVRDMVEIVRESAVAGRFETSGLSLRVDGGVSRVDFLMQMIADFICLPVERGRWASNTSSIGAALLAGVHVGMWADLEAIAGLWRLERRFEPRLRANKAESRYTGWKEAVRRSRGLPRGVETNGKTDTS